MPVFVFPLSLSLFFLLSVSLSRSRSFLFLVHPFCRFLLALFLSTLFSVLLHLLSLPSSLGLCFSHPLSALPAVRMLFPYHYPCGMCVWQIKTTSSQSFAVRPYMGLLEPGAAVSVRLDTPRSVSVCVYICGCVRVYSGGGGLSSLHRGCVCVRVAHADGEQPSLTLWASLTVCVCVCVCLACR